MRYILLFGNGIGLTTMTITLVALHLRDFVTRWNLARGSEGYVEYDEGSCLPLVLFGSRGGK